VTGGTQTSLSAIELRTTGAADADMPMTKEKRSATGVLKIIKVQRRLAIGAEDEKKRIRNEVEVECEWGMSR